MAQTRYQPEGHWMAVHNGPYFSNRPLYCNHNDAYILAGDKPLLRFTKQHCVMGTLELAAELPDGCKPLHECADITFRYTAGAAEWVIRDDTFRGAVTLRAGTPENRNTLIVRVTAEQPLPLLWRYGGLAELEGCFGIDPLAEDRELLEKAFFPDYCANNRVTVSGDGFVIHNPLLWKTLRAPYCMAGSCSAGKLEAADGCVSGRFEASPIPIFLTVSLQTAPSPVRENLPALYDSARRRARELRRRIITQTPDAFLDTFSRNVAAEIDGAWYPPVNVHNTTAWNEPYLGWCNRFGNTFCGWFDRLTTEIRHYLAKQEKKDVRRGTEADPDYLLTKAAPSSRLYGQGHIHEDQRFYNMQSQFFDQAIHGWRSTGDEALGRLLYPALELHTKWQDECFDPDEDGLYESYINTWPTDSVWYSGGGSAEETAYAYRAHQAAKELALRYGRPAAAERHERILERIRTAFHERLWMKDAGCAGQFVEQLPPHRLHTDPWLYNCFLPVDVGLTTPDEAAQSVLYSTWAFENDVYTHGGRTVWLSNWVPSIWSVRANSAGENFQLAYAFFRAGFPEEGLEVLTGTVRHFGFDGEMPGDLRSESASLGCRCLIEGLFGYRPDLPNGRVTLSPCFPRDWDHAELRTTYIHLRYRRTDDRLVFSFKLSAAADVTLRLPVSRTRVLAVRGADTYTLHPAFGGQEVHIPLGRVACGMVEITLAGETIPHAIPQYTAQPGTALSLPVTGELLRLDDPQGALASSSLESTRASVIPADAGGHHLLFAQVRLDGAEYRQVFRLDFPETAAERALAERQRVEVPQQADFRPLDIAPLFNGDVREIYRQAYLSPRPATISVRIGTDDYSPWTFPHWDNIAPEITLEHLAGLRGADGLLRTTQGVPFAVSDGERNIAFTSTWDNWPTRVTVPADTAGKAVFLLICGTTSPMQGGADNARLLFRYADGTQEMLPLRHPVNYWSLCPLYAKAACPEQGSHCDYSYETDAFCLPATPPETLQLGQNCRAMVTAFRLREDTVLTDITLESLSPEIVCGVMAVTILR